MKRLLTVLLTLVLAVGFALTLTACGNNNNSDSGNSGSNNNNTEISEVGKKYMVNNYKTDVNFEFDNSDREATDQDKLMYSTMWLLFKENNAVEIFLNAYMPMDDSHFYAINSERRVEFFDSEEDAKNLTKSLTDDYFGWKYQFDSNKKTLTVSARSEIDGMTLTMVLACVD